MYRRSELIALSVAHRCPGGAPGEQRVCELRLSADPPMETGRHRPLSVQCMRPVQQDEWTEPTAHQTTEEGGE